MPPFITSMTGEPGATPHDSPGGTKTTVRTCQSQPVEGVSLENRPRPCLSLRVCVSFDSMTKIKRTLADFEGKLLNCILRAETTTQTKYIIYYIIWCIIIYQNIPLCFGGRVALPWLHGNNNPGGGAWRLCSPVASKERTNPRSLTAMITLTVRCPWSPPCPCPAPRSWTSCSPSWW